jgi:hypothetical protein
LIVLGHCRHVEALTAPIDVAGRLEASLPEGIKQI